MVCVNQCFVRGGEISISKGQHLNPCMNYSWRFWQLFYQRLITAHGTQTQPSQGNISDKSS